MTSNMEEPAAAGTGTESMADGSIMLIGAGDDTPYAGYCRSLGIDPEQAVYIQVLGDNLKRVRQLQSRHGTLEICNYEFMKPVVRDALRVAIGYDLAHHQLGDHRIQKL